MSFGIFSGFLQLDPSVAFCFRYF